MQTFSLAPLRTILCLGAHADDIEIGCGGTLLKLLAEQRGIAVHWIVFSGAARRAAEAQRGATHFLRDAASRHVQMLSFRDSFFPYAGLEIKEFFAELKTRVSPDLIFTHRREDLHQDHRTLAELTWNAFRDHQILEYEIPKYEGDLGSPNVYVTLDKDTAGRKVEGLMTCF
ncbi:MAG TPA: PIG-L deacetylase family protein, partial [Pirellulales bacterium]|nr:PIG-L deacetylase family protein [Pirellulales bacterium]